jgi:hypothetical protein
MIACAASLAACASSSAERKPAATAQTEPAPHRAERADQPVQVNERVETKQDDVKPVAVAPVGIDRAAANADTHDDTHAVDQGNGDSDLAHTQKIRSALMEDDSLSFAAKNAQIVSDRGEIILRGRVENEHDKQTIEKYARQVAGKTHVHNELQVKQ